MIHLRETLEFIYSYHPVWILLITVVAFFYAFFLYRKEELQDEVSLYLRWLMAGFRFFASFLLLLLLLGIVLERSIDRKEKPLIFLATDNSASVLLNKDSSFYKNEFPERIKKLKASLEKKFEVVDYSFSDELSENINFDYSGKSTDIANVFSGVFSQYPNRNVGGIVMATDGIYNQGMNPIYTVSDKNEVPIFTIGMGDTVALKDFKIDLVEHNNIAFYGNDFPVEVLVSHIKCAGEKVRVELRLEDNVLSSKEILLASNSAQTRLNFVLKAGSVGFKKYTVSITRLDDEFSYKNNSANFYLEVIDGRQKILITTAEPHPDIAALRFVIENNKNYEVDFKLINEVTEVKGYDLIVLYNYTVKNNLIEEVLKSGERPFLIVAGIGSDTRLIRDLNVGLSGSATTTEDVGISFNSNFKEILFSPAVIQTFSAAPPLAAPFGNYSFSKAIDLLAYQKVGSIVIDKPLLYFTKKNSSRIGVLLGEGFWRWRLFDQSRNGSTENFEQFFTKIISYLALKENKDPFRVIVANEFSENESVTFKAELYNKSFELINEPEVMLTYSKEDGKEFRMNFIRTLDGYKADLGNVEQGIYSWSASVTFLGVNYTKKGTFLVKEVKLEWLTGQADHKLLKTISKSSNGVFYLPTETEKLTTDILNREDMVTIVYQEKVFDDLIDYKWVFALIFCLIALEWIMRKYHGAY